eukprot:1641340-Rhodomonas_salina.1
MPGYRDPGTWVNNLESHRSLPLPSGSEFSLLPATPGTGYPGTRQMPLELLHHSTFRVGAAQLPIDLHGICKSIGIPTRVPRVPGYPGNRVGIPSRMRNFRGSPVPGGYRVPILAADERTILFSKA